MDGNANSTLSERIRFLEDHLHRHPTSPLFARLADCYNESEQPEKAYDLLRKGLESFPRYSSAHFIYAKTLLLLHRYDEAWKEIVNVIQLSPASIPAYQLEKDILLLQSQFPTSRIVDPTLTSPESSSPGLHEEKKEKRSKRDDLIPGAEIFIRKKEKIVEHVPTEQTQEEPMNAEPTDDLDLIALAAQLENAKIPVVADDEAQSHAPVSITTQRDDLESRPLTPTLARIYEDQERLEEAIRVYTILKTSYPDRSDEFDMEIERLTSRSKPLP